MDTLSIVYATFPDLDTAERIAAELVAERLAACVNLLPGMVSVYAWKGAVERGQEVVALIKTRAGLAALAMDAVRARHPYEVPALFVLPAGAVDSAFGAYLLTETAPSEATGE